MRTAVLSIAARLFNPAQLGPACRGCPTGNEYPNAFHWERRRPGGIIKKRAGETPALPAGPTAGQPFQPAPTGDKDTIIYNVAMMAFFNLES
jgi:hypothetical protein